MKKIILPALLITIFFSFINSDKKTSDPITEHIDSSIAPGKNFFLYANNKWFKANPIPSSESSNGIFRTIQDTIDNSIHKICELSAADTKAVKGSNKQKIGDFYFSGMDTIAIEKAGITPLNAEFSKIDKIKNIPELLNSVAELNTLDVSSIYGFAVTRDERISSK